MAARKKKKTARKKSARRASARKGGTRRKATRRAGRKRTGRRKAVRKKTARKRGSARTSARRKATRRPARRKAVRKKAARKPSAPGRAARPPLEAPAAAGTRVEPLRTSVAAAVPERIGRVTHFFARVGAGIVALEQGELRVGDTVHFRGQTTDFYQRIDHMEIDHQPVEHAGPGQEVGIQVSQRVRENDEVFRVTR